MSHTKRTFTNIDKDLTFNLWKQYAGLSDMGRKIEAPLESIFT